MNQRFLKAGYAFFIICLMGCSDNPPDDQAVVRDSLGIRIVENGPLSEDLAYELQGPLYQLGASSEDHSLGRTVSGVLLSDGRAAVADGMAGEIVVLEASGEVEMILGGPGEGPGEFGYIFGVFHPGGDSILVVDVRLARATVFHGTTLVRTERLDPTVLYRMLPIGAVSHGSFIMRTAHFWPYQDDPWVTGVLARYTIETQTLDTLLTFDLVPSSTEGVTPNPFRPRGSAAAARAGLLTTRGDRSQVERFTLEGELDQLIRWSESPRPLEDPDWDAYEAHRWSTMDPFVYTRSMLEEQLTELRAAAAGPLPFSTGVRGDDEGNVWVADYSPDARHPDRYRVFSPAGRFRGWVEMPPRFEVFDVAQSLVLGIHRDELDQETVALYRLR